MKLAIFDLGNVYIKIDFMNILNHWENVSGVPKQILADRFKVDLAYEKFEKGQIAPKRYYEHICDVLDIRMDYRQFLDGWNSIYIGIIEEVRRFIIDISNDYRVVALTNTNVIHYKTWSQLYKQDMMLFQEIYLSFDMGTRKPEIACYEQVLESEQCKADEAFFFDDSLENVQAASSLGIRSFLVNSELDFIQKFFEK